LFCQLSLWFYSYIIESKASTATLKNLLFSTSEYKYTVLVLEYMFIGQGMENLVTTGKMQGEKTGQREKILESVCLWLGVKDS
jgi:hypothetical protein